MTEQVDAVVVGLGVGGEEVAGRLADAGLSVVGVERRLVGGECPYYACIPTKMMVRAARTLAEARRVDALAGRADVRADWAPVARRIRDEATDGWDDRVAVDRLVGRGARFVRGTGRLAGPRTVAVRPAEGGAERVFEARRAVVLGAGTDPAVPNLPGLADTPYWTNREAVATTDLPASITVLGGGPIGVEFAQVFARFGVAVTVLEAADALLPNEEPEAGALVGRVLANEGVTVRTGTTARHVHHDWRGFTVRTDPDGEVTSGRLLVTVGRRSTLTELGLDTVGLDPTLRFVGVDPRMRAAEGLYAVGDLTEHGGFTHMAMYQADIAVRDILGEHDVAADYRAVPRVTFTDPEVGAVGLTERRAATVGIDVRTGSTDLAGSTRGWLHGPGNDGLIKLVADAGESVLVGATTVGPSGGELVAALTVAVHGRVPLRRLRSMIGAFPTFHRALSTALADLG